MMAHAYAREVDGARSHWLATVLLRGVLQAGRRTASCHSHLSEQLPAQGSERAKPASQLQYILH
jgi:hypothetical protein